MRRLAAVLAALLFIQAASAAEATVEPTPIVSFDGVPVGGTLQHLVFRGGLVLRSTATGFGGLSGIGFVGDGNRLAMVSDRGFFVSGALAYDAAGAPSALAAVDISPIENAGGRPLPRNFVRDAESLAIVHHADGDIARIGFENLTRVADFAITNGVPGGAAREVAIPDWISRTRTNSTLESLCVAPATSPIAGSTLLLMEAGDADARHPGTLLGHADRGPVSYQAGDGTDPSDCAFLPDGDLLVLERGVSLLGFAVRLVQVPAATVRAGATLSGTVLFAGVGGDLDNMEGVAVHPGPGGETRITLISDNNFNDWERTLLLEFALAPD